jgi:Tol biopolymer transport system component
VALTSLSQPPSLWELSALGGNARRLSDDGTSPAVSPDGKEIAFVAGKNLREEVWLMAADGGQPRRLLGEEGDIFGTLAWSPDSSKIAYTRGKFSYAFGVKGGIEFADVRTRHVSNLLQINTTRWFAGLDGPLTWASDGHLVYSLSEPPPRQLDSNLWSVALDQKGQPIGTPVRLTNDVGSASSITASADGKRVVYVKGSPQPDVYVARVEGRAAVAISEPQRLTLDDRQDLPFDWTSDGKEVIFISDRTGTFNIYKQALDQTVPELLVGEKWSTISPRLSPDGTQLLYLVYPSWSEGSSAKTQPGSDSMISMMRIPIAGGAPQQVLQASWINNHQCARAPGKMCVYTSVGAGVLTFFSFDPLTGKGAQIYQIKDDFPQHYNWSLSPDGTSLAISKGKWIIAEPRIHLVSTAGGPERWLTIHGWPGVASLDWAADGKSLWAATVGQEENGLLQIDLQGHAHLVWRPKKMNVGWAIPSRDGRYLALHVGSGSANVWMVERP